MDLGLRGRTAIVCGASSGMGLAVAEALAAEGANVAMFARRRDLLEGEADRIGALAVRGGRPAGPAAGVDDHAIEVAVELLLLSAVRLTNLCLPHLEASGRGRIVNI